MEFNIQALKSELSEKITHKINTKTKPLGSLGKLESIALKISEIQNTLTPKLINPTIIVCAGDHGVTEEGISPFPQEVTFQMVMNYLSGGAAINVFTKQNNIDLLLVDTGVNFDFESHPHLIDKKIAYGTKNFTKGPAMTQKQCDKALNNGAGLVDELQKKGTNIIGFGEMGIGNTTAAAALLCAYTGCTPNKAAGAGTGLDEKGIAHKASVIEIALQLHKELKDPMHILAALGGFEMATITGAMLQAAKYKMTIMIDGFIVTSALLAAYKINNNILDYCIFSHKSHENGHDLMLNYLQAEPILDLDMRLGEGTGSAVAYPIIESAIQFLNRMSSFEDAGVSNR
ncbi:nicotinate-nucleotide--dimethylbenzimidazole phosphoribosyltransferase [Saccharicrinis fermentans]|uniref:Nicotinate-nucleotide--dimethylbenzimidazole phosphoribosyltransferase n=1 Tax=Saccharicrinis fermentans DSM 9555 = JCM 21142 TaxID=869213 RepID=W7YKL3_9BACT|nr:nicotinate-nucleotide--dimethylbenzimidazole phosphoribosyltransferase [Saccharicrinis fermentans]GAF05051.1 nicotinate-nucleotide-dimethylbenzimidazole phosphoribosyltransferase [Saccharicrinis fermentans DSM 9555 = JCM 21142]